MDTISLVGPNQRIIQIAGSNGRLYCFGEQDERLTIVCTNTFWIGGGDKKTMQDRAIAKALALRERWRAAAPVPGYPDLRIERKGKK